MFVQNNSIGVLQPGQTADNILATIASSMAQERPFFVFNVDDMLEKHGQWTKKLPTVRPLYSVLCNDNDNVLQVLASIGVGFTCGSEREIRQVLSLGVATKDIMFGQPHKIMSHLRFAARKDVRRMMFDCEAELQKIEATFPAASLILCVNMTTSYDPKKEAIKLLKLAQHLSMNVVGLKLACNASYFDGLKLCKKIFSEARYYGFNLQLLDLGDVPAANDENSFEDTAMSINKGLQKYFPESSGVEIVAEPGRYFVDTAFTLATTVHAKKVTHRDGAKYCMYYINDGVYGSFSQLLTNRIQVHPKVVGKAGIALCKCTIWGPTCDSLDKILEDGVLPELDEGDWIFFENLGAYSRVLATSFNSFPVAKTISYISLVNFNKLLK